MDSGPLMQFPYDSTELSRPDVTNSFNYFFPVIKQYELPQ